MTWTLTILTSNKYTGGYKSFMMWHQNRTSECDIIMCVIFLPVFHWTHLAHHFNPTSNFHFSHFNSNIYFWYFQPQEVPCLSQWDMFKNKFQKIGFLWHFTPTNIASVRIKTKSWGKKIYAANSISFLTPKKRTQKLYPVKRYIPVKWGLFWDI